MHRIVRVLRGGAQDPAGTDSLERRAVTLDEVRTIAERAQAAGLSVHLTVEVGKGLLTAAEEMTAVRIVQECLTNVLRHAGAGAEVKILLREDEGTLLITVVDDGAGRLAGGGSGGAARVRAPGGTDSWGCGSGWRSPVAASRPARVSAVDGRYVLAFRQGRVMTQESGPSRVVVVDDQPLIRAGFSMVLAAQEDIDVVGEAENGAEALDV